MSSKAGIPWDRQRHRHGLYVICVSCNFVNMYTIAYRVQYTFTRVHARIPNRHPREEKRACRTSRRTSRRGSSCVSGSWQAERRRGCPCRCRCRSHGIPALSLRNILCGGAIAMLYVSFIHDTGSGAVPYGIVPCRAMPEPV